MFDAYGHTTGNTPEPVRFRGQDEQFVPRLRREILDEGIGLSVGTYCWTFHRSAISYALVQATVGIGTVIIWCVI